VSRWTPCKRAEFIRKLRSLGFEGPFSATRHQFMSLNQKRLVIPSNQEYSVPQLRTKSARPEIFALRAPGPRGFIGLNANSASARKTTTVEATPHTAIAKVTHHAAAKSAHCHHPTSRHASG
jgi:hypothetical protein